MTAAVSQASLQLVRWARAMQCAIGSLQSCAARGIATTAMPAQASSDKTTHFGARSCQSWQHRPFQALALNFVSRASLTT